MGKFGLGCIRAANKAFLQAAVEIINKVDDQLIEVPLQKENSK